MDRKTWIAIGLSAAIFIVWQKLVLQKYQHPQVQSPSVQTAPANAGSVSSTASALPPSSPAAPKAPPSKPVEVPMENGELSIGSGAKVIEKWAYRPASGSSTSPLDVNIESLVGALPQVDFTVDSPEYGQLGGMTGVIERRSSSEFQWSAENDSVRLVRDVKVSEKEGYADVTFKAEFKKGRPNFAFVSLVSQITPSSNESHDHKLVYFAGKQHHAVAASEAVKLTDVLLPVEWIGVEDRYFILAVADRAGSAKGLLQPLAGDQNRISLVYPVAANTLVLPVRVFFGPKSLEVLKSVHNSLGHAVDFGWLNPLAFGILNFMKWLYSFLGNYGAAIILLTVILKMVLYPLTYKSMKSMKKMADIQPQLQKIRERYKDNKEALNREMLTLMRTQGYNPVSGCLPMILQMPIFFALYRVLYSSFELYRAPFALWIHDLSKYDPTYVTPVLLTGVMYLQQKLTPTTVTDPAQQKMLQLMPVIFGVFMLWLPAGLTLYMLTNALMSIIQQIVINKQLGIEPAQLAPKAS